MRSLNLEDLGTALKELGEVFRIMSFVFLIPIPLALYFMLVNGLYDGSSQPGLIEALIGVIARILIFIIPSIVTYLLYLLSGSIETRITPKTLHVMLSVSLGWLIITLIGSLPFILSGTLSPLDAWFESMSGWTTTGLSLLKDIDSTAPDILFYRSLTQWVGGVGIIVMALAVFMRKGTIATDYYSSERGGIKIKPSIKGTVKETWKIYSVYTLTCMVLLYLAGMSVFDAMNHSMVTLATGGFSTHGDSIGYEGFKDKPLIEPVIMLFMIVGSISFLIHFRLFEGRIKSLTGNIEFRHMSIILFFAIIVVSLTLYFQTPLKSPEAIKTAAFQSISALSCAGLSTADLSQWSEMPLAVLIMLMYIGGIYGSTSGGIKLLRLIVMIEAIVYSMKRLMLPRTAMLRIKLGERPIEASEILTVFGLSAAYMMIAFLGALLLIGTGYTAIQSLFLSFSAMSNVGLSNAPAAVWFMMPDYAKLVLIILMWVGRLEVFPVMILLSSIFIKKKTSI